MKKKLRHTAANEGQIQEERTSPYWIVFHKLVQNCICIMLYKFKILNFPKQFPMCQISLDDNSEEDFIFIFIRQMSKLKSGQFNDFPEITECVSELALSFSLLTPNSELFPPF